MKFLLAMGFALLALWAVAANAAPPPAEAPPPDFAGAQYIDSQGCVFLRTGAGWIALLDRDGALACGYPPTFSARRLTPEVDPLATPIEPGPQGLEEALASALADGLRDGELITDTAPRAVIAPPPPVPTAQSGPLAALPDMIEALPALREASFAGGRPNERLCVLLGPATPGEIKPALGDDPTQGLCGPLVHLDLPALSDPAREVAEVSVATVDKPAAAPAPNAAAAASGARAGRTTAKAAPPASPVARSPVAPPQAEMVPHWARFVQIGRFEGDSAADAAMARLRAIGYPVARSKAVAPHPNERLVLAGPFPDRARLIAALADLRKRGYAAVPR